MKWWVWCCFGISAQAASVHGTVVDATEAPLWPEVVIHGAREPVARTKPGQSGDFTIDVPPGVYLLEIRAIAFVPHLRRIVVPEKGAREVGMITLELSGCEYPAGNCSDYGRGPRPVPAVEVLEVCAALRQRPKDRWVVVVGRRSPDGKSIEGDCGDVPTVDAMRLPSRIALDGSIVEEPFSAAGVKDVEKKIEGVRSRLRNRGETSTLVVVYGYLAVPTQMKMTKCTTCTPDFDVSPAHLLAIEAYRELP